MRERASELDLGRHETAGGCRLGLRRRLQILGALLIGAAPWVVAPPPAFAQAPPTHIYWTHWGSGTIGRANLDGTGVVQDFITGASGPRGVAVDDVHLYWTNWDSGTIGRANLDGTEVVQDFITGARYHRGIAVDAAHLYWTNGATATIDRANLDGTGVVPDFITAASATDDVAVGPGADPPAAGITPTTIDFSEVITGQASAAATVTLTNAGGGTLTVAAAALIGDPPGQFTISRDGCDGAALEAGEACTIALHFTPTVLGAQAATLEVPHNTPASPATVTLTGTGVPPPTWTISGTITDGTNAPVAGATVSLTGGPAAADDHRRPGHVHVRRPRRW